MSARAFEIGMPGGWGSTVVSISLILFAFSTLIGWSFYGETGIVYLFGPGAMMPYRLGLDCDRLHRSGWKFAVGMGDCGHF